MIISSHGFAEAQVQLNGSLRTDNRVRLDDGFLSWNENRLTLQLSGGNMTDYSFYSEVWLRGFGFPRITGLSDLQRRDKEQVIPWGLEFREAYLELYAIGLPSLDVRIGRQIINWGTGDGFNPTGNVNPDDLEDLLFFGTHLGVNALKATYYASSFRMTGIYIPVFTPATLPPPDFREALLTSGTPYPGLEGVNVQTDLALPTPTLKASSQYAVKVATLLRTFDVSLSYYYGRYDLPVLSNMIYDPNPPAINATMSYPRMQVLGGDFAGAISDVGVWGEAAWFFPEKVNAQIAMPSPAPPYQMITRDSTVLSNSPYPQYLLGTDYTFQNGWYVNLQYLHGLLHERGTDNLHDYFVFRAERDFFNGKLTLSPVAFAMAVTDWKNPQENYGIAGIPELTYQPTDNVDILLGSFLFEGEGQNLFHSLQNMGEVFLRVKVSF